jgi:integrase
MDRARILSRSEVASVIANLKGRRRSVNARQNLIVFRLSACCGLRVSEIATLRLCDVQTGGPHPHILIPETSAKRSRPRRVPLWWDRGTLADIEAWKVERFEAGAKPSDPLVCSQHKDAPGKQLSARNLQHRWMVAIKVPATRKLRRQRSICTQSLALAICWEAVPR